VLCINERLEKAFHKDSYAYRPGRSAIDALSTARQRCWKYDWVLDMDISKFFDSTYMQENGMFQNGKQDMPLFHNLRRAALSRGGITHIRKNIWLHCKAVRVTPHVLRHSKAMHLLKAGVNLVYQRYIGACIHTISLYNASTNLDKNETVSGGLTDGDTYVSEEYTKFDLRTTLNNYSETQKTVYLNIPVMALFQIEQIYAMGGLKFGIPVSGKYATKNATLTNEGYYPELDNSANDLEFAGYGTFKGKNFEGDLKPGMAVILALEAGSSGILSIIFRYIPVCFSTVA
jgi:hypothetical protein